MQVLPDSNVLLTDRKREELGLPPRLPPQPAGMWTCINTRRTPDDSQLGARRCAD